MQCTPALWLMAFVKEVRPLLLLVTLPPWPIPTLEPACLPPRRRVKLLLPATPAAVLMAELVRAANWYCWLGPSVVLKPSPKVRDGHEAPSAASASSAAWDLTCIRVIM